MAKYRTKIVEIEAELYDGTVEGNRAIIDWTRGSATPAFMDTEIRNCSPEHPDGFDYPVLKITTLEGDMRAQPGDYIIRGLRGEHYPCKPDVFTAKYESV